MSLVKDLHPKLLSLNVVEVVRQFENSADMRLADASKGVLLALQPPKSTPLAGTEEACVYDCFLSHKRTEAKDFARALYNLLVLRGFRTFLDFEVK